MPFYTGMNDIASRPAVPPTFGFYAILTDPLAGYERLTRICVDRGVAFVQLRMKNADERAVLETARLMRRITAGTQTRLIVNDYPAASRDSGADGVHVGQSDLPYAQVRAIVGPDAIVGVSTHSPRQTAAACAFGPDYIGVGPVFPTPTKKTADPAIGVDGMKRMLEIATVPAVVLGSITPDNLPDILRAGARNFSMVRPVNQAADPDAVVRRIMDVWRSVAAR